MAFTITKEKERKKADWFNTFLFRLGMSYGFTLLECKAFKKICINAVQIFKKKNAFLPNGIFFSFVCVQMSEMWSLDSVYSVLREGRVFALKKYWYSYQVI